MKRFLFTLLGIAMGILSGFLILSIINNLAANISTPTSVGDLISQAISDESTFNRIFATAILISLFVVPVIVGILAGWKNSSLIQVVKVVAYPFFSGALAVIAAFLVTFIIVIIEGVINFFFDAETIGSIVILYAIFIAMTIPCTRFIIIIFD